MMKLLKNFSFLTIKGINKREKSAENVSKKVLEEQSMVLISSMKEIKIGTSISQPLAKLPKKAV